MIKVLISNNTFNIIDDAESTPGMSRQITLLNTLLKDVKNVGDLKTLKDFKIVKIILDSGSLIAYLQFVGTDA